MRDFVFRWAATTLGVMVASGLLNGIHFEHAASVVAAALLLGILNAFVRPLLLILSAPLILLSLGFFVLVVNALMLLSVPAFVPGFYVERFGSAFCGALIISIISWILSALLRPADRGAHGATRQTPLKQVHGRVLQAER